MARPREFDVDATLERAMQAFWAKGYRATSLDDLCAALEAARSRGEISPALDIRATARFLVASIQGMRLVGKAIPERAVLEDIRSVMLRSLDV
ncbi:MAG: hypothetical protein HYY78_05735 [Betaproteobacteria bacterium]|nr:hypothetical protein [Betaproteobacteria bacterium]